MKTFRKTFVKSFIKKKLLRKASTKAQSAMEYLMTYGWAILIVAVVLGALYSLGVFNGAAFLGTSCISASGFYCANPTLSTGGVLTVTIGQATGTTFENAYLYFVPSGTNFSTSDPGTSIGTLNSGQQVTASIPLGVGSPYPAAYTLGTPLSGYLYLQFTDIYGTTEVDKIATVLTKVTAASSGSATFSQPTSIPSGIVAYVPIILSNSQSSATPSPFQQMIQINEGNYANYIAYNGNIANFEFFTQSGSVLPAWIESNNSGILTVWVKLPNGIPASSSFAIYLGFASKTTNLLSSSGTSGIGEAPQLSPNYGEYDDGASVFNFYDNFSGTSLNTSKWTTTTGGASYTVNNGLTITGNGNGIWFYGKIIQNYPSIFDVYVASYTSGISQIRNGFSLTQGDATNYDLITAPAETNNENLESALGAFGVATANVAYPSSYIQSLAWIATGSEMAQVNYGNTLIGSNSQYTIANYYPSIWFIWSASGSYTTTSYWVRTRAYPPNGVMPSVSFGGLSSA